MCIDGPSFFVSTSSEKRYQWTCFKAISRLSFLVYSIVSLDIHGCVVFAFGRRLAQMYPRGGSPTVSTCRVTSACATMIGQQQRPNRRDQSDQPHRLNSNRSTPATKLNRPVAAEKLTNAHDQTDQHQRSTRPSTTKPTSTGDQSDQQI